MFLNTGATRSEQEDVRIVATPFGGLSVSQLQNLSVPLGNDNPSSSYNEHPSLLEGTYFDYSGRKFVSAMVSCRSLEFLPFHVMLTIRKVLVPENHIAKSRLTFGFSSRVILSPFDLRKI